MDKTDKPYQGLLRRLAKRGVEITPRIEAELALIRERGWAPTFLTLSNFRHVEGAIAGSQVAYELGITDVDPVRYNLEFRGLRSGIAGEPDFCIHVGDTLPVVSFAELDRLERFRSITPIDDHGPRRRFRLRPDAQGEQHTLFFTHSTTMIAVERIERMLHRKLSRKACDDDPTYESLACGAVGGIPELEVPAVREALRLRRPQRLDELMAILDDGSDRAALASRCYTLLFLVWVSTVYGIAYNIYSYKSNRHSA
jgi:hypothetical protein